MPRSALILSRNPHGKAMKTIHPGSPGLSAPSSQIFLQKSSVTAAATLSVSQASDQSKSRWSWLIRCLACFWPHTFSPTQRQDKTSRIRSPKAPKGKSSQLISSTCKISLTLDALHTEVVWNCLIPRVCWFLIKTSLNSRLKHVRSKRNNKLAPALVLPLWSEQHLHQEEARNCQTLFSVVAHKPCTSHLYRFRSI